MLFTIIISVLLHALNVLAAPYIVTSYVELSVHTQYNGVKTYTKPVVLPSTITAPPSAIATSTRADKYYTHVSIVDIVLSPGLGKSPSYDYEDSEDVLYTTYMVPLTFNAPTSCSSTSWAFTTTVAVYIPPPVRGKINAATLSTSASTYTYEHRNPVPTTNVIAILNPTDVDPSDLASASSKHSRYYYYTRYTSPGGLNTLASPTSSSETSRSSSRYESCGGSYSACYNSPYQTLLTIIPLVIFGWSLLWFLIGLLESWYSFKGLMQGEKRKRGIPYSWCCISWLCLCFTGPVYKAKTPEEQVVLKQKWAEMKIGAKMGLWVKWGFRFQYPVEILGAEPEIYKRAFRQGCL
ncbi:hypothetical protein HYFRA_00012416 [Hymenoscyphus fraxineus]|uniref:Uncharacterized protein n=1 Tax=Hymenoscyphus fraxineus TaxID=746836 RepID=A0A9N9LBB1_9HELO|nr:hypothetical protein HYFRA_00012416 [Hymenoscyphus fraxineus]